MQATVYTSVIVNKIYKNALATKKVSMVSNRNANLPLKKQLYIYNRVFTTLKPYKGRKFR